MSAERTSAEPGAESKDSGRQLDLLAEIGGPQGAADSSIPAIVFVTVYALGGNRISLAGICAIGAGLAITALRLAKGESLRFALTGFVGIAIAAFIADRTGRAEDFFLPGLLLNAAYASVFLISILIRRPLLGVILGPALGREGMSWRQDPHQLRVYSRASWVWQGKAAGPARPTCRRRPSCSLSSGASTSTSTSSSTSTGRSLSSSATSSPACAPKDCCGRSFPTPTTAPNC